MLNDICSNKSCDARQIKVISNYVDIIKDIPHLASDVGVIKNVLTEENILRKYTENFIQDINENKLEDGCANSSFVDLYTLLKQLINGDTDFTFFQCLRELGRSILENTSLTNKNGSAEFFYVSLIPRPIVSRKTNFSFLFRAFNCL